MASCSGAGGGGPGTKYTYAQLEGLWINAGGPKLVAPVALEDKQRFAVREGGKTVGAGVVTKIIA